MQAFITVASSGSILLWVKGISAILLFGKNNQAAAAEGDAWVNQLLAGWLM